ncbi:MAG: hypothetical protein HC828_00875 [Blastochloris sp.]|nr:hypothetical protein [Blastochloris sp.]
MNYVFDILNLEILNRLVFDSSFDFEEMMENRGRETFEIQLDRRAFENVSRTKGLFGTRTRFDGRLSLLQLTGFKNLRIEGIKENFKDNHFLNEIYENEKKEIVMASNFGLVVKLEPSPHLRIELLDKGHSDFGKGGLFGKKGFTKHEWTEYLKEKKYAPQH